MTSSICHLRHVSEGDIGFITKAFKDPQVAKLFDVETTAEDLKYLLKFQPNHHPGYVNETALKDENHSIIIPVGYVFCKDRTIAFDRS
jgi:hypothetical protein